MRYVIIRTVDRKITVIGKAASAQSAMECLVKDFESVFWEKYAQKDEQRTFKEAYEEVVDESECEIDRQDMSAFINGCHGYDYDWEVCDLNEADAFGETYHILSWNDEYLDLRLERTKSFDLSKEEAQEELKRITLNRLVELKIVEDEKAAEVLYAVAEACEYPDQEPDALHVGPTENTIRYTDAEERIRIVKEPNKLQ